MYLKHDAKIVMKANCGRKNAYFRPRYYKAGEAVTIVQLHFPDEPMPIGTIGYLSGQYVYGKWSFWTSFDIDGAYIFDAEDVATLQLSAEDYASLVVNLEEDWSAPFKVEVFGKERSLDTGN